MEITKRDYFAAHALSGLIARGDKASSHPQIAADAFAYADEMLKLSKTLMAHVEVDPAQLTREVPGSKTADLGGAD